MNINLQGSIADLQEALKGLQMLILTQDHVWLELQGSLLVKGLEVAEKLEAQVNEDAET